MQVFKPVGGGDLILGAVGVLQFEVVAHRLEHEYGCKARIMPSRFQVARWVTCDEPAELKRFIDNSRAMPFAEQVHLAWYCVRATDRRFEETEAAFIRELRAENIGTSVHFVPVHRLAGYAAVLRAEWRKI